MDGSRNIVVVGHVDHGKSTLLGRILLDCGRVEDDKLAKVQGICEGKKIEFQPAFLLDALEEEQEQGISIDSTRLTFYLEGERITLIDAPGHTEFLRNMAAASSQADCAILVLDCQEGIKEQTIRHLRVLKGLGLKHLLVVLNKMDLVDYSREEFEKQRSAIDKVLHDAEIEPLALIPICALSGANVCYKSEKLSWCQEGTLLSRLADLIKLPNSPDSADQAPLRMILQDVYKFDARRLFAVRVVSGSLTAGERILFSPSGKISTVATIEKFPEGSIENASAGDCVALTLAEQVFVERGEVLSRPFEAPEVETEFDASLIWISGQAFDPKKQFRIKVGTTESICQVLPLKESMDASDTCDVLTGSILHVKVKSHSPLAFDRSFNPPTTSRFVLCTDTETVAAGLIQVREFQDLYNEQCVDAEPIEANSISRELIESRQGYRGKVVWLTGLSGSGKSTIAKAVQTHLFNMGINSIVLDGDKIRHGLCADLGFSTADRSENLRRIAHVARLFLDMGSIVLVASISPFAKDRKLARMIVGTNDFREIFVSCPLNICQTRDPKGLYTRMSKGEISGLTGYDAPYQAPSSPDLILETSKQSVEAEVEAVLDLLNLPRDNQICHAGNFQAVATGRRFTQDLARGPGIY